MSKNLLAFLAFVSAALFFGVALFGGNLGAVPLLYAGLFCCAVGLALWAVSAELKP